MTDNRLPHTLSLAAHELKTPLAVAAGYLRMVLKEQAGPLSEKQRKMLEEADRACGRLSTLITEMSTLARFESQDLALARHDVDVTALVREVAGNMHEGDDRGVRIQVSAPETPLIVAGDRTRMSGALHALMRAALRERGEPGIIMADCSTADDGDTSWAVLAIGDASLIGMLRQGHAGPFTFNERHEWNGGLGLAVPIARRVIEAHGGAVWSPPDSESRAASALRLPWRA
jgi:signal transduction histidine kinase